MKYHLRFFYFSWLFWFSNIFILNDRRRAIFLGAAYPNLIVKRNVKLRRNINFYGGHSCKGMVEIGENSFINEECFIDHSSMVSIGSNVAIGMRCMILSSSHNIGNIVRCGKDKRMVTTIKDNCWLGAGVIVFPGITIGQGCVISAGEKIDKDIPDNILVKNGNLIPINM
ncbi:MAG: acyltransferase [Sulfurovaceae bacterium]|nr:acyltransferase [Sulfurovaceae bacterium]